MESGRCKETLLTLMSKSACPGVGIATGEAVATGAVGEIRAGLGLGVAVSADEVQAVTATANAAARIANASGRLMADVQWICFEAGVRRLVWGQIP